jgi:C_GCAxxG_C_C family probable redox protein
MHNLTDEAVSLFNESANCCQAILSTFAPSSLPREVALKMASPFGGGMGRMGEVCGAVTGAIMVIGLKSGFSTPAEAEQKHATYAIAQQFADRFRALHGSILCRDLVGHRIDTPESLQQAKEKGLLAGCPNFVRDAADLLADLGI